MPLIRIVMWFSQVFQYKKQFLFLILQPEVPIKI